MPSRSNTPQCSAMRPPAQRKTWTSFQATDLPVAGMPGGNGAPVWVPWASNPDRDQLALGQDRPQGRGDVREGGPHAQHGRDQLLPAAFADPGDVVVEVVLGQRGQKMPPGVGGVGKAVQAQRQRAFPSLQQPEFQPVRRNHARPDHHGKTLPPPTVT